MVLITACIVGAAVYRVTGGKLEVTIWRRGMKLITSVIVGAACAAGWAFVALLLCLIDPGLPAVTIVAVAGAAFVGGAGYYGLCANGGQHEKK